MNRTIIAGLAVLLLSGSMAVAQSSGSHKSAPSTGTSAAAGNSGVQSNAASDTATATTPRKTRRTAGRYPKGEARLNADEAQTTKQLNMQESQEVASNRGTGFTSSSSGNEMNGTANSSAGSRDMNGAASSSSSSSDQRNSASQPQ